MAEAIQSFFAKREAAFFRFIDKRIPASTSHRLSQKNLFIFPTTRGFIFLLLVIVLWVLGTNYQNNLILSLAFFMVSLFVLAILLTFQNLNRLNLRYSGIRAEVFAEKEASISLYISQPGRRVSEQLEISWRNIDEEKATVELVSTSEKITKVPIFFDKRGTHRLPRLRVQSTFPLGIIRCWTWLDLNAELVVFPKPMNGSLAKSLQAEGEEADGLHPVSGGQDFAGLKPFVPGDSLRRVSWKSYAKGQGLFIKDFSESLSSENWLSFDSVIAKTAEERLSILAFWVLQLHAENESYGLSLPSHSISPNLGEDHRITCLRALAEF